MIRFLTDSKQPFLSAFRFVLSGRNILALTAERHNIDSVLTTDTKAKIDAAGIVPVADMFFDSEKILKAAESGTTVAAVSAAGSFRFIAAFPEIISRTDWAVSFWEGLARLAAPGCIAVAALPSADAERLDRGKPGAVRRLGDIKRSGFRALVYERLW
jgi:hypothetical protein